MSQRVARPRHCLSRPLLESVECRLSDVGFLVSLCIEVRRSPTSSSHGFTSGDPTTLLGDHGDDSSLPQHIAGSGVGVCRVRQHALQPAANASLGAAARDHYLVQHRQRLRIVTALTGRDVHRPWPPTPVNPGAPWWSTLHGSDPDHHHRAQSADSCDSSIGSRNRLTSTKSLPAARRTPSARTRRRRTPAPSGNRVALCVAGGT